MPLAANSIGGQRAFPLARRQRVVCYVIVAITIVAITIITAIATRIFGRRKFLY